MNTLNTSQEIDSFKTKVLNKRIGFTDTDCQIFFTAKIDGKKIYRRKSDSFTFQFAMIIAELMAGLPSFVIGFNGSQTTSSSTLYQYLPSSMSASGNNTNISLTSGTSFTAGDYDRNPVLILFFRGVNKIHNGIYYPGVDYERVNNSTIRIFNKHLDPNDLNGEVSFRSWQFADQNTTAGNVRHPRNFNIVVGKSDEPVKMTDAYLFDPIPDNSLTGLQYGAQNTSVQVTTQIDSTTFFNKSFTNNTGQTIEVKEIGLGYADNTNGFGSFVITRLPLLIRDSVPGLQIPDGSTLTIEYEIQTALQNPTQNTDLDGSNGGIMAAFITNMRAYSNLSTSGVTRYGLRKRCVFGSGESSVYGRSFADLALSDIDAGRQEKNYGVVVGTNNFFTSTTDENLFGPINHGTGDGELLKSGTFSTPLVVEEDKCSFKIISMLRNMGSIPVVIKEVGLRGLNTNDANSALFVRNALAESDWVTVEPGEGLQVTYTFEFVL